MKHAVNNISQGHRFVFLSDYEEEKEIELQKIEAQRKHLLKIKQYKWIWSGWIRSKKDSS